MKFQVEMLAFQPEFKLRPVNVPDNELAQAKSVFEKLDLIFRYGQNDFQPVAGTCSVSAGDVIRWPNKKALNGEYDCYLVQSAGFHLMTGAEYEDYERTERRDRSFYPLIRQMEEPKPVGYWVMSSQAGEIIKWGLNGNTVFPYSRLEDAVEQAKSLTEPTEAMGERFYIITVFNNGQMKTEEYEYI